MKIVSDKVKSTQTEPMGAKQTRTKASKRPQWEPIGERPRVTGAGPDNGCLFREMREGRRETM
jgi:hypothetical protein